MINAYHAYQFYLLDVWCFKFVICFKRGALYQASLSKYKNNLTLIFMWTVPNIIQILNASGRIFLDRSTVVHLRWSCAQTNQLSVNGALDIWNFVEKNPKNSPNTKDNQKMCKCSGVKIRRALGPMARKFACGPSTLTLGGSTWPANLEAIVIPL